MPKPVPVPDEVSKPFWDACDQGRLVMQTCAACDRMQYPPEAVCRQCGSAARIEWRPVSGRGKIHGYCVMYQSRIKQLQQHQPFNIAIIELEEDPAIKLLSSAMLIPDGSPSELEERVRKFVAAMQDMRGAQRSLETCLKRVHTLTDQLIQG